MMDKVRYLFAVLAGIMVSASSLFASDNARYVDPFMGVDAHGNTFCGAARPFSMVKLGPDMYAPGRWNTTNSGYSSGAPVYGFSHTHVSGTGGGAKYGHFAVMPLTDPDVRMDHASTISSESAEPGYYCGTLDASGIFCELTLTHSVGFHRYQAPAGKDLTLFLDVCSILDKGTTTQHALDSGVEVLSDTELCGYLNADGGWNCGAPFKVYFYAVTDVPFSSYSTWRDGRRSQGKEKEWSVNQYDHSRKAAALNFSGQSQVCLKLAISYISVDKARENYQKEAAGLSFDDARAQARADWNSYLDRLEVTAGEDVLYLVYTGLYRSLLMPVRRTGEMPGWNADEVYCDDYYAIWDTFRTVSPLLSIIAPEVIEEQIQSLVNIASHEDGFLPDARSGNCSGMVQGGSDADMLIADAVSKGILGFDVARAFEYMLKSASVEPVEHRRLGRGGIEKYVSLGFLPSEVERSGSRQMEYAACDYAIHVVADHLGQTDIAKEFLRRSAFWKNLWKKDATDGTFSGFIVPRNADGSWDENYDLLAIGSWKQTFYEGNSWQYSLYVPHDVPGLIEACGGREAFVSRLDRFFEKGLGERDRHYYNVGNEPSFLTPFLYTWAGRADKTYETVGRILDMHFHPGRDGLPGNDDSGAMSSWAAFACLGIFPVAGSSVYVVCEPRVEKAVFHLRDGKMFCIEAKKVSGNVSRHNPAFISHSDILSGKTLKLRTSGR